MTSRPARVFVSHSSHTESALARLDAIVEALKACGFEVLHDKRVIAAGDEWRERINAMLWECDAAAVLLTADAITSPWVLKEATILSSRRDRNPHFPLIPVALDGLDPAKTENPLWDPLDLGKLQHAGGTPAHIANQIGAVLAPLAAQLDPTPLDLLATDIAAALRGAEDAYLDAVIGQLEEPFPPALADDPLRRQRVIAGWMLKQSPPALRRMAETLRHLGKTGADTAREILKVVYPLWVPADIVSWFVRLRPESVDCRHLAISCERPTSTLKDLMYVADLPLYPRPLQFLNGGPQPEDIVAELIAAIVDESEQEGRGESAEEVRQGLSSGELDMYVALPVPSDPTVVDEVREQLPGVTFIFHQPPPEPLEALGHGVGKVHPLFDDGLEHKVARDYSQALRVFKG